MAAPIDEEEVSKPFAVKRVSENARRKGGQHCPVCVARLGKNRRRTKRLGFCDQCQAHPTAKRCRRCTQPLVWENKHRAACQSCALTGPKATVISARP